jgi:hypothetical protein
LVPGGVQEVLHMRHDAEVLYLRKRLGFVRLALQHGAPLVPAFAFGQCHQCVPAPRLLEAEDEGHVGLTAREARMHNMLHLFQPCLSSDIKVC